MMVVVAVVALALGSAIWGLRMRRLVLVREDAEYSRRRAAHYASLKRNYERAARYPWLSVETDPPEAY
jgi:hypothetical protein